MSMIDGLRNVLGINQDPEADSYVDDNEEDDIFPGGGQGGSPAPEEAYPTQETAKQHSNKVVNINATTQLQVVLVNNGQIKRVATSTFIITPYNVDIMGDLLDELENNGVFF